MKRVFELFVILVFLMVENCVSAKGGYVTLRPERPIITQVTKANTKYIIRKNIDLSGRTLTMPDNCILIFKGGKLSNGTIVGCNTKINGRKLLIFDNVNVEGTWNNTEGYPEWFGAISDPSVDSKMAIQKAIDVSKTCVLSTSYYTSYDTPTGRGDVISVCAIAINGKNLRGVKGNKIFIDARYSNTERTSVFWVGNNVVIDGVNIEFLNEDHSGWTGTQAGVYRVQGGNVIIQNTSLIGAMAAWINLEGKTGRRNYIIKNNYVHDCDCGLIIQGNQHQTEEVYDINLLMEGNIIEKEKERHSEMVSFWGMTKDTGRVYYTGITIRQNKFSGGWRGGCIAGHPTHNGLKNIVVIDNEYYDCGACSFYNTEGLVYERNYVTGSTFIKRYVNGEMGSYPDLNFVNCRNCVVNNVSCFGLSFTNCTDFRIGKVKQTLCLDIDDPYLEKHDYITNFIGIKADNSTVIIDELTVNPFAVADATTDKCKYFISKANSSEVIIGKMYTNIPVIDTKKLLRIKNMQRIGK